MYRIQILNSAQNRIHVMLIWIHNQLVTIIDKMYSMFKFNINLKSMVQCIEKIVIIIYHALSDLPRR